MRPLNGLEALVPYVANIARNTVRQETDTGLFSISHCLTCTTPVQGWSHCIPCNNQLKLYGDELADRLVPLSYGVRNHPTLNQYYFDLHSYKGDPPAKAAVDRFRVMAFLFTQLHMECLERAADASVDFVTSVPSGRGRRPPHPLEAIRNIFSANIVSAQHVAPTRDGRAAGMSAESFAFPERVSGHLLILEDAWFTGKNVQSLAVAARRAGAEQVSIVVLGRVLDMTWATTAQWVKQVHLEEQHWSPYVCPVSGTPC